MGGSKNQQKPPQDDSIKLETSLVTVPVLVLDKKKNYITDLKKEDFAVFDNNRQQKIEFFSTELNELITRPLAVMFLLDASGSAVQTIRQQRAAAQAFLQQMSPQQLVAVARFSEKPELLVDFTTDKKSIADTFTDHDAVGGETAIFDALDFAVEQLNGLNENDATRRKIVILITDGLDNASRKGYGDVARKAENAGVAFYVIYLPLYYPGPSGHLEPRPTTPGFTSLGDLTGGQVFTAGDVQTAISVSKTVDLSPIFQKITDELRSQYYLGYYQPGEKDGTYHRFNVKVQRKDSRLRMLRRGYFAR